MGGREPNGDGRGEAGGTERDTGEGIRNGEERERIVFVWVRESDPTLLNNFLKEAGVPIGGQNPLFHGRVWVCMWVGVGGGVGACVGGCGGKRCGCVLE